MKDNLTSLYLFSIVCKTGSIAKAAEQQNIVASAVSKRMSDLEVQYNAPLLLRSKKGVEVTEAGAIVLNYVTQLLNLIERMNKEVKEAVNNPMGEILLLANISSINEFLPEMIANFSNQHPHIRVMVEEKFSHETVSLLQAGIGDFGIARRVEYDANKLTLLPFKKDNLVVVANKNHPLTHRNSLSFIDTLAFDHLSLSNYSTMNKHMKDMAKTLGIKLTFKNLYSQLNKN